MSLGNLERIKTIVYSTNITGLPHVEILYANTERPPLVAEQIVGLHVRDDTRERKIKIWPWTGRLFRVKQIDRSERTLELIELPSADSAIPAIPYYPVYSSVDLGYSHRVQRVKYK